MDCLHPSWQEDIFLCGTPDATRLSQCHIFGRSIFFPLDVPIPLNQIHYHHNDGNHKQNVDEGTPDMGEQTKKPQDSKNYGDRP
jgi:hypothetical protein